MTANDHGRTNMTDGKTALEAGLHFIVPVWGEAYTRLFADVCLPTLVSPGNIPALPHPERHVFTIYTTPEDRFIVEASPAFRRLAQVIKVEFHPIRARVGRISDPYDVQSDCFRRAIRRADAAGCAMVFLTPDLIMADGSLRALARIADTPVRAVLGVGIRLDKARTSQRLASYRSETGDAIAIAPRDLVRLALDTLHPIAKSHMFHAESEDVLLSNLYWRVANDGLLARCFHLHPFLVYPRVKNAPFTNTVDGDYLEAACPDPAETYVIADSDEFSAWELSDADRRVPTMSRAKPLEDLLSWVRRKTTPRHRALIRQPIRIHCGMSDAALWQQVEQESGESMAKLVAFAEQAGPPPAASRPKSLRFMTTLRNAEEARAFVEIALPSALAPGNIPRLPTRAVSRYTIVAAASCVPVLEAAPAIAELREHIAVEIRVGPDSAAADPDFIAACQFEALRDAAGAEAAAFFIGPDFVLSGAALDSALRTCDFGIRGVVAPPVRLDADAAVPLLADAKVEGLLSIPSEALVRLAMAHLHPASASQLRGGGQDQVDPGALLWRVGNEGFVMHAFAFDPVFVWPRRPPSEASDLCGLLVGAGLREEEIGVFRDSTPFALCRLTKRSSASPATSRKDMARWIVANTAPLQRRVFQSAVRLSTGPVRGPLWQAAQQQATAGVLEMLAAIEGEARRPAGA
jgi:hypothetical protein